MPGISPMSKDVRSNQNDSVRGFGLPVDQPFLRSALVLCLFGATFYFAYRYAMSFSQVAASPFWFPDSVLLCALLMVPPGRWWMFVLAALPIRLLAPVSAGLPLWFLLTTFAIDSAKGLLAAVALRRFLRDPIRFETVREFALYCLFTVLLVPAVSAFGGAAARHFLGYPYWPAWEQWFMGNALAQLVVTPFIFYWVLEAPWNAPARFATRWAEGALLTAGLIATAYIAFDTEAGRTGFAEPRFYAPVPFLFWAAIRFGMFGATGAIAVIAFFSVAAALEGPGTFSGISPADTAVALQHFLLLRAAPLYLAAVLIEQKRGVEHSLRERVKELTALHRAARILQNEQQTTAAWLQQLVAALPPAWQYPDITAACIRLGELEFSTPNFKLTLWNQRADFSVAEGLQGTIEVVYLDERPAEQEGPFLAEERNLIDSLAEMLRATIERRQAQEQVSLLQTIAMEVGAADDLSSALKVVLHRVCEKTGWVIGQAWIPRQDGTVLDCSPAWFAVAPGLEKFRQYSETATFPPGMDLPGRVWSSKQPAWGQDVTLDTSFLRSQVAGEIGLKVALAVPILRGDEVLAVIEFFTREPRHEDGRLVKVITAIAAQLGLVIERKRADEMLRETEAVLRASYDRNQDLAGRLITAQEAERARIAGDLHDDINQQLASLSIALSNVRRRLHDGGDATVQDELTRVQQRTIDLADVIRNLSHQLHPGVLQHAGLIAALKGHCAEVGRQHAIELTVSAVDGVDGIPQDVALCLYRVAQEALRNITAHAGARKAQVTLKSAEEGLELLIVDDGQGFDLAETRRLGGLGLISLEERVRLVGGNLTINTAPQRGTEVRVQVPLRGNQ